jgi:F0F1-type ATP synthase assembly protein I
VFSAYIYHIVDVEYYQSATSYLKATALLSTLLSGVLGDILVVIFNLSLEVLFWISAVMVLIGFTIGCFVIRKSNKNKIIIEKSSSLPHTRSFFPVLMSKRAIVAESEPTSKPLLSEVIHQGNLMPQIKNEEVDFDDLVQVPDGIEPGFDNDEEDGYHTPEIKKSRTISGNIFNMSNPFLHNLSFFEPRSSDPTILPGTSSKSPLVTPSSSYRYKKLEEKKRKESKQKEETKKKVFSLKLELFSFQLQQLKSLMKIPPIMMMISLWIIGNAVYTVRDVFCSVLICFRCLLHCLFLFITAFLFLSLVLSFVFRN